MLERLLKLYTMSMQYDIRSPMPHLVGPPGCGKSTAVEQLARLLDVQLHIINVSRLSPLEIEGVQMPLTAENDSEMRLHMLPATFWTSLKEGDILLMEEFLNGEFASVYNGLLDVFTSRRVGAYHLPRVFLLGASNTVIAYNSALEDRLLHLPVPDPRINTKVFEHLAKIFVNTLGLLPSTVSDQSLQDLFAEEVYPMYEILDSYKKKGTRVIPTSGLKGQSLRKLIGQAQLREVQTALLKDVLNHNNTQAMLHNKPQYVFLVDGKHIPLGYEAILPQLVNNPKLTELQQLNAQMNLELILVEQQRKEMT